MLKITKIQIFGGNALSAKRKKPRFVFETISSPSSGVDSLDCRIRIQGFGFGFRIRKKLCKKILNIDIDFKPKDLDRLPNKVQFLIKSLIKKGVVKPVIWEIPLIRIQVASSLHTLTSSQSYRNS